MPKKTKQEKIKEDVASSVNNDGKPPVRSLLVIPPPVALAAEAATLSGVFSNDFPIACVQNNLPKISVKHIEP